MRPHPHLYETNTLLYVRRLFHKLGREVTLASVPKEEWHRLRQLGMDLVWLMGVWRRSPGSRREALRVPQLRLEYSRVLPGWTEADVAGSPYAVYDYTLEPALGAPDELAETKRRLNRLGLGLVLDFVPNHLALDHRWTQAHPDWFVQGTEEAVRAHPEWFFSHDGRSYLAHGRDPYFPPWTDTVQVNFFSGGMRQALICELLKISDVCDGVRCDMAMLGLDHVFEHTWGQVTMGFPTPQPEFWEDAIRAVKSRHPGFIFIAEAYWGLERQLQELGFDYTYDKTLYDRLRHSGAQEIRAHLAGDVALQGRMVRFIENHDEQRAAAAFEPGRSKAAAVVLMTVPGMRLLHDGQMEGRRLRLPVQLAREPVETPDADILQFYERLLRICDAPEFHQGEWRLLDVYEAWEGNDTDRDILAWWWRWRERARAVVVNYSAHRSQARVRLPVQDRGRPLELRDQLDGVIYVRDAEQVSSVGLHVDLGPWEAHIFDIELASSLGE